MPLTTVGVVSAVTPSVVETYFSHFLNRGPLRQKPTAHISYHEGLRLIRQFLEYSSKHTVEDLQAFTAQWVPAPHWVRIESVDISDRHLARSAKLLQDQLGERGQDLVGGKTWWQWRRPDSRLRAEWVEMKKDIADRRRTAAKLDRAILYVHGGAYYFGSVDEHRYQIQRHARKMKARILAPRYRLAPQFPFPCALHDCIAAYLFLLEHFQPSQILFAGDSAGGGLVLSMLAILRDQGQPLPAGTILLSPWVDLTHSFPSVAGDGGRDYIPAHGFHHKPSMVWPPSDSDELETLNAPKSKKSKKDPMPSGVEADAKNKSANGLPGQHRDLSIVLDDQKIDIKDQIQMYAPNHLLAYPLVSPVQLPSLGGLPPMLIQVGGGELLRDEQIYLAHKAADPRGYPPGDSLMAAYGLNRADVTRYPPTYVQLQVWDDLCHVPHTLSFTRPAKYMFRSVAQFGAWALAHAQHKDIEIEEDANSIISSGPDTDNEADAPISDPQRTLKKPNKDGKDEPADAKVRRRPTGAVGSAGDPLPPFKDHMIRQRVDRHGVTYPLALPGELACLHLDPDSIGAIKPGPVRKWLAKKKEQDGKFANERRKVQKKRLKEMSHGYEVVAAGERPPPTALAGRRRQDMPAEKRAKKSWGLAMWSGWGSSHDEVTIERGERMEHRPNRQEAANGAKSEGAAAAASADTARADMLPPAPSRMAQRRTSSASRLSIPHHNDPRDRMRSPNRRVSDVGQADDSLQRRRAPETQRSRQISPAVVASGASGASGENAQTQRIQPEPFQDQDQDRQNAEAPNMSDVAPDSTQVDGSDNTFTSSGSNRPHNGSMAYPFKIRNPMPGSSTGTIDGDGVSTAGTATSKSTPEPSIAPSELFAPEKELVLPSFEKEVVVTPSSASQLSHLQRPSAHSPATPYDAGRPAAMRMRPSASDHSFGSRDDAVGPSPPFQHTNGSGSLPSSPIDGRRPRDDAFRMRNPSTGQQMDQVGAVGAVNAKFGGGSNGYPDPDSIQPVPVGPPKPVGFAYNPRDLRNAMLHRHAAETAAASAASASAANGTAPGPSGQPKPLRQQTAPAAHSRQHTGLVVDAVELPATVRKAPQPQGPVRSPPRAVNLDGIPVELSAVKQTRASTLPAPRSASSASTPSASTAFELSAVRQSRDSIAAPPRQQQLQQQSHVTASPTTVSPMGDDFSMGYSALRPVRASPAGGSGSPSDSAARGPDPAIRENIIMPIVEQRKPTPSQPADHPQASAQEPAAPGSRLKDFEFGKFGGGGGKTGAQRPGTASSRKSKDGAKGAAAAAAEKMDRPRTGSKPPVLAELSLGSGEWGLEGADGEISGRP